MMVAGCYNCKDRFLGCHAYCDKYKKYRKQIEIVKANRIKYMERFIPVKHCSR